MNHLEMQSCKLLLGEFYSLLGILCGIYSMYKAIPESFCVGRIQNSETVYVTQNINKV